MDDISKAYDFIEKASTEDFVEWVNENAIDPYGTSSQIHRINDAGAWSEFEEKNEGIVMSYFLKNRNFKFTDTYFMWDENSLQIFSFSYKNQLIEFMGGPRAVADIYCNL